MKIITFLIIGKSIVTCDSKNLLSVLMFINTHCLLLKNNCTLKTNYSKTDFYMEINSYEK